MNGVGESVSSVPVKEAFLQDVLGESYMRRLREIMSLQRQLVNVDSTFVGEFTDPVDACHAAIISMQFELRARLDEAKAGAL